MLRAGPFSTDTTPCVSLGYGAGFVQYYNHNAWLLGRHYPGLCGIFAVLCYTTECISYQTVVFIWGWGVVLWSNTGRFLSLSPPLSDSLTSSLLSPLLSSTNPPPHTFLITRRNFSLSLSLCSLSLSMSLSVCGGAVFDKLHTVAPPEVKVAYVTRRYCRLLISPYMKGSI